MLQHYINIALRNFIKYKLQTVISIVGLAIGLVCFAYGINWLKYETTYDGFYPQSKQIYRLYGIDKQTGKKTEELPLVLARKLKQDFPEIKTVNQILNKLSKSENASLQLFSLLAILCTVISVFGLYSISSSNIAQRRKEVAVRKVMGASSATVISMFIREYISIAVIANLVALPLAWLFMHGWLEQYPYRINIHLWMYLTVLISTIILIICTVLYQTLKASETNPAEVIKNE